MGVQAKRISSRRKLLTLSQEELAELAGTSQRQISKYENGVNDPTGEVLAALARALETSTDWLLGLTDNPTRPLRDESDLSDDERELLQLYRGKPAETRRKVLEVARVL